MEDRPVATARVIAVVVREPGEPVSPELVLVCPELASPPEDDARQGVARALAENGSALRPPIRATRTSEPRGRPGAPHANAPVSSRATSPRRGRDRRRHISTYAVAVIAIATAGTLGWRSSSHSTDARPSIAPPLARTPTPSAADAVVAARASKDGIGPATGTARPHTAPADTAKTAGRARTASGTTRAPVVGPADKPARAEQAEQEIEPSGLPETRRPTGPLFAPDAGQRVISQPQLTWDPVADVRGYRLKLYRGEQMLLEVVSHEPKLTLAGTWRFKGRRVALTPGTYWWYVWPIPQAAHAPVQPLLKASSFVVVGPASRR